LDEEDVIFSPSTYAKSGIGLPYQVTLVIQMAGNMDIRMLAGVDSICLEDVIALIAVRRQFGRRIKKDFVYILLFFTFLFQSHFSASFFQFLFHLFRFLLLHAFL